MSSSMTQASVLVAGPFALGEGPLWHAGRLWWIDILAPALHACAWDGGERQSWPMSALIGCVAPATGGGLLLGLADGVYHFDPESGARSLLAAHAVPGNRLNDGKPGPDGRLLVGGLAIDNTPDASHLFRLEDGHLIPLVAGVSCSNGLAWSADGQTLYYIDTGTRRVDAFDYAAGRLANRRPVHAFTTGWPDGMTIDAEGLLWVALWDGGAVVRIDPATGSEVGRITVPARRPTCCTFAGPALDHLVITTARIGLDDPQAEDGALLVVNPGVRGLPAHVVTVT